MGVATVLAEDVNSITGIEIVRLTMGSSSDTYNTHKFADIVAAWGNNESDDDGVGVAVSGQTVTLTAGSGDVITLMISGRK